jgi:hypothetical protein
MNALSSLLHSLSPALAPSPDDDGSGETLVDDPLRYQSEMFAKETADLMSRLALQSTVAHMAAVALQDARADLELQIARLEELGVPLEAPEHLKRLASYSPASRPALSAGAASRSLEAWRVAAGSLADPADAALDLRDRGANFVSTSF